MNEQFCSNYSSSLKAIPDTGVLAGLLVFWGTCGIYCKLRMAGWVLRTCLNSGVFGEGDWDAMVGEGGRGRKGLRTHAS